MSEIPVTPHRDGFCATGVGTTPAYVNLTTYAGRYVKIYAEEQDVYIAWGTATSFTMKTDAGAVGSAGVVDRVDKGGTGVHVRVDADEPWLGYRTVSGSGAVVRVIPTSQRY